MTTYNVSNALQWLEDKGWSELIDERWTLEVYHELQTSGLNLTDVEIREALDIVIFHKPDYNPANNERLTRGMTTESHCTEILPDVKAYYNAVVRLQDTDIIVSTLWSYIRPEDAFYTERGVSDFYRIMYNGHRMRADDFNQEHERCKTFIQQAVLNSKAPNKVVLTHHVPTFLCQAKEFVGSKINGAFVTELGDYIATSNIDYWIYGHSHRNIDAEIGHTRILSNQLGYITHGEHLRNGYKNSKYIEI